ncbi:DExH-box ATP-dependent RNA helicase DExH11 isoform X1, partial [Tanacetum coccineum]
GHRKPRDGSESAHTTTEIAKDYSKMRGISVVRIKGRVVCEMNWGEELVCIKCLFENQLDDLEPEEAVYLMSGFVFQQRNAYEPSFTLTLLQSKERSVYLFVSLCT